MSAPRQRAWLDCGCTITYPRGVTAGKCGDQVWCARHNRAAEVIAIGYAPAQPGRPRIIVPSRARRPRP